MRNLFKEISKKEVHKYKNAIRISRFETIEKAERFYSDQKGNYIAYLDGEAQNATSTPVFIYKV